MIEVFKTDVPDNISAQNIIDALHRHSSLWNVNFDLEDCDKILRVDFGPSRPDPEFIISYLASCGHQVEVLPDEADMLAS